MSVSNETSLVSAALSQGCGTWRQVLQRCALGHAAWQTPQWPQCWAEVSRGIRMAQAFMLIQSGTLA